jgi:hypothetical protein
LRFFQRVTMSRRVTGAAFALLRARLCHRANRIAGNYRQVSDADTDGDARDADRTDDEMRAVLLAGEACPERVEGTCSTANRNTERFAFAFAVRTGICRLSGFLR